jgi:predicted nuclease of restriction endonuclease-like (RecB) superfamily
MTQWVSSGEYQALLADIKQHYCSVQLKAAYAVNQHMIQFYWHMGKQILEKQTKTTWGSQFLNQLSRDLQTEFPGSKGFSVSNLERMRKFASLYPTAIPAQAVRELPWGHIVVLVEKVKDPEAREWYAQNAIKNGISRNVLMMQIKQDLYHRQGHDAHKITNFIERLPSPQSDLALQLFKDPYDFRFLPVTESSQEQEIEHSMTKHLSKLFLELGTGFAFMGNQYKITIDGRDFFLDMLFYHTRLRCYFIIELKSSELKPEHIGKLNFYLAAIDDLLKTPEDNPSIGLLLCQKKSKVIAEYALKRTDGPIGIAEYRLLRELPRELAGDLPPTEILESKLNLASEEKVEAVSNKENSVIPTQLL